MTGEPQTNPTLVATAHAHPYRLLFCTISGAHLYGFPSPDSDFDLRGVHVLPVAEVVSLKPPHETVEESRMVDGMEIDLVTHDVRKFIGLMLKRNGYVLEQLLSPLVVMTTPEHQELCSLAPGCITKHHAHHYFGFAETQWGLVQKEDPPRVKPLLYLYRVLLTGIHLMKSGEVLANLTQLSERYPLPFLRPLIEQKLNGKEQDVIPGASLEFHSAEYEKLKVQLQEAYDGSRLPESPTASAALDSFLVRVRMSNLG